MEPSILIVGAGTFGTSTAYHLAQTYKNASRVQIIDRAPSPPEPAAAIDINRIIRTDYSSLLYCDLAYEALHTWFWSLELQQFFHQIGWVLLDEKGSSFSERSRKVFKDRGYDPTEDVLLDKLGERWHVLKGTETKDFQSAYFNSDAGWCNAAGATNSFMEAALKRGVKRLTGEVTKLLFDKVNKRVTGVCTEDGQHLTADKIVLATGAWTSSMLSPIEDTLGISAQDRVERQIQATGQVSGFYKVTEDEVEQLSKSGMPIIVYGEQGELIPPSRENQLLKYNNSNTFTNTITTNSGHKISAPADRSQYDVPENLKRETEQILVSKCLPHITQGKKADYWRVCWDAKTPTGDFLLCKHPHEQLSNLYLAVGGSFHSYKFVYSHYELVYCETIADVYAGSYQIPGSTWSTY